METCIKQFKETRKLADMNLSAESNIGIDKKEKAYCKFINKSFKGHNRVSFEKAVEIKHGTYLLKGALCYKATFNGQINLFITEKEQLSSRTPCTYFNIIDAAISPEYLLWFLDHKEVKEYLNCFSVGTLLTHIPTRAFYLLEIPYPKQGKTNQKKTAIILQPENGKFKHFIAQYHKHYKDCYQSNNYFTAAILAGAIAETHLYVFLIDAGISQDVLNQKTLGALIDLTEVYLLNRGIDDFPLNDFKAVQKLRNRAVHPVINITHDKKDINENNFGCFKRIIKYFGL